jgi:hypothetical protein
LVPGLSLLNAADCMKASTTWVTGEVSVRSGTMGCWLGLYGQRSVLRSKIFSVSHPVKYMIFRKGIFVDFADDTIAINSIISPRSCCLEPVIITIVPCEC